MIKMYFIFCCLESFGKQMAMKILKKDSTNTLLDIIKKVFKV